MTTRPTSSGAERDQQLQTVDEEEEGKNEGEGEKEGESVGLAVRDRKGRPPSELPTDTAW